MPHSTAKKEKEKKKKKKQQGKSNRLYVTYKGTPIKRSLIFQQKLCRLEGTFRIKNAITGNVLIHI